MKSGRKIYRDIGFESDWAAAVHGLGNGSLRSLISYLMPLGSVSSEFEKVLAVAVCEAGIRFWKKAKEKAL